MFSFSCKCFGRRLRRRTALPDGFTPFWDLRRLYFAESFRQFVETERETTEPLPTLAELAEMIKRATQQGATEQIMDQVELLTAIIEASVALIGFSGLVIALGRRSSGERPIWPIGYYTLVRLVVCAYPDVERQLIGVMSREDRGAAAQVASEISDRPIWAVAATRQLQGLQGDGVFGRHR